MHAVYWVARRELHTMMRAPIVYMIGGLFLAVQGLAFAGLVDELADRKRAALLGTLLEGQFAGTLLTWILELIVIVLLGMRSIADDRRSGAWELLLTASVSEPAAVIGKWIAASLIYAAIWLPTLVYYLVLAAYRDDAGGWDVAAIACGYGGAIAIGSALLAWVIAASAASESPLAAGVLALAIVLAVFLIGELPGLSPSLAADHPTATHLLTAISPRAVARDFAHGEIAASAAIYLGALAVSGLSAACAFACVGRRRRRELRLRFAATGAVIAIGGLATALALRHPARLDVSADRHNTLDDATRDVVAGLGERARITIVAPTLAGLSPIYSQIERVAERMAEDGPIDVRIVDPAAAPGGVAAVARSAGVPDELITAGGAVVCELRGRIRTLDVTALASVSGDEQPHIERLAIEQALAGAFAELALDRPLVACLSTGHGELASAPTRDGVDLAAVVERLHGEGVTVETVAIGAQLPRQCSALVIAGPSAPITASEALAVQSHVRSGGGLVMIASTRGAALAAPHGLESVLGEVGLAFAPAIAVDPERAFGDPNGFTLVIVDGYPAHPINEGFAGVRGTIWPNTRPLVLGRAAAPLVVTTAAGWGERDLGGPPARGPDDLAGPIVLAATGHSERGGRIVALGSDDAIATRTVVGSRSAADLWLARAVKFAAGVERPTLAIAERAPSQVRVVLTDGQRRAVVALSIGGIPLAWAVLGGVVVWWRRRDRPRSTGRQ